MALHRLSSNGGRRLATIGLVLILLWPALVDRDGLPLSTYPMYAGTREPVLTLVTARGVNTSGAPVSLSTPQIAETRDPLIAQSFLNDAVSTGRVDVVCREIATRVGADVVTVEIAHEVHDVVRHVRDDDGLISRETVASCEVGA